MNDVELVGRVALDSIRRTWRVLHAVLVVTKRHVPKWVAGVLTVCLFIPGPLDELLVLLVIAVMVAFKPAMRHELVSGARAAWRGDQYANWEYELLDIERNS